MSDLEIRNFAEPVEFRAEGGKITAVGTLIRYGALSKKMGGFVERIMPGAAKKTLENRSFPAFHEHPDPRTGVGRDRLLGTTEAGTLRLFDDDVEMRYELDLPDTTAGRDAATLLERRDLSGASYGFLSNRPTDKWTKGKDGLALRSVTEFRVFDHMCLTCMPAYPSSTSELALRSLADATGVELRSVLEAAEHRTLGDLIDTIEDRSEDTPDDDEPPDDPPVAPRRLITSLYL